MTYDPMQQAFTAEETAELKDGNLVSVRISVQDGAIVGGAFVSSPGYALKASDVDALPWEKATKAARAAERSANKEEA